MYYKSKTKIFEFTYNLQHTRAAHGFNANAKTKIFFEQYEKQFFYASRKHKFISLNALLLV